MSATVSSGDRRVSYAGTIVSLGLLALGVVIGSVTDDVSALAPLRRDGKVLVRADLHVHTRFSDGLASPFDLVLAARRHGLDAIAVTEHNLVFPARLARAFSNAIGGPTVLVGQEITSRWQHVGALGIHTAVRTNQPLPAIVAEIHRQGGLVVACHPVRRYWPRFDLVLGELDAIEVIHPIAWRSSSGGGWSGADLVRYYERARSRGVRAAAIGSSDFHFFKMLGLGSTWILADDLSAEALVRAIRDGHTATRGPTGPWYGEAALVRSLERHPPPDRGEKVGYDAKGPLDAAGRLLGLLGMACLIVLRGARHRKRVPGLRSGVSAPVATASALLVTLFASYAFTKTAHAQDAGVPGDAATAAPRETVRPPRLLDAPALELPPGALPLPEGAAVSIELVVGEDGTASEARIVTPLREDVDAAALALVPRLRFEPARRGDRAIAARIRFRFAVRTPPPPPPPPPASTDAGPARDAGVADAGSQQAVPDPRRIVPPPDDEVFESTTTTERREEGAATRVVLAAEELTTVPGTFGEPLRVVATMPGVLRTPFGIGYFLVRGASFENTGFLVDGFPVPVLYHFGAGPAVLSSRLVSRLDFYPGGYPVSYGRFSAGLISLTTAPPPADRLHLEGEIDLFRASALAVIPFAEGRGSVALAFRRSYYDLILPLIVDGIDLAYSDYQLRADFRVTNRLRASIFVFGSDDALDSSQAAEGGEVSPTTTSLGTGFHRVIARLSASWPNGASASWAGTAGFDFLSAAFREPGTAELRTEGTATYLAQRVEVEVPVRPSLRLSLGADAYAWIYRVDLTFPTPPGLGELPRPDFDPQVIDYGAAVVYRGLAGWMQVVVRLGRLEVTPGIRLDSFAYGEVSVVEPGPRIVVRQRIGERLVLKAATGLFSQPAQPFQVEPSLGNPGLRPHRSWQSSVGFELRLPESIEIESSVYYSAMTRLARPNEHIELDDGIVSRELYTDDGEGRAYGAELLVRRRVARGLYGWLSYTLSRSERFLEDGNTTPFDFDQTHTLNVAASYKLGGWRFGARFTLSTGRPNSVVVGAIFDADSGRYRAEYDGERARLPVYHQLDIRIDRDFRIGPLRGSIYLDVLNVYYARNAEGRLYQYDYADSQPLPGLPILGTLGVRLEYH